MTRIKRGLAGWGRAAAALVFLWSALQAQGEAFRFRGLLSRVITPNADSFNDEAIFCVDNPAGSAVTGTIYTLLGSEVSPIGSLSPATGTACPQDSVVPSGPQILRWDGRSNGAVVRSGIYIYSIKSEGLNFTGSLVVVR